jgi:hypothetical protein
MNKSWQAYALHILDVAAKIERIQARGDQQLPPFVASVQSMLAANESSNT